MYFFEKIKGFASKEGMSRDERASLETGNIWAVFGITASFGISVVLYFVYPNLAPYFLAITTIGIIYLLSVWLGVNSLFGRIFLATLSPFIFSEAHTANMHSTDGIIPGITLLQAAMIIMPWVLFNIKERVIQFSMITLSSVMTSVPIFRVGYLNSGIDNSVLYSESIHVFFMVVSFVVLLVSYLMNINSIKSLNDHNETLWSEMEEKQQDLEAQSNDLKKYVKQIEEQNKANEIRQWEVEGLANLANLLRNGDATLTDGSYLSALINYLEANQGAVYKLEEEGDDVFLTMMDCYAYGRKKFEEQRFLPGQGIVGQAYLERREVILTEIPQDYVRITSGLGEARPNCVIVVPCIYREKVWGMLELASFKVMGDVEERFLTEAGKEIAAYLSGLSTMELLRNQSEVKNKFLV
ncbi:hypothetical protein FUAX_49780 (plasmid) [Fulvitalea axinellae]|uniref:GAF domain-containing protein n=1 Tax=Fulvitalea axinellae TaxID=1182444 RepID=A0AAU9CKH0_9BACT|nr:hypothetical protein FUAX_49780 [Fulvitalea axinellae]